MNQSKTPKIRVLIRKRPMNKKEIAKNQADIISVEKGQTIIVREQKVKVDLTPYIDQYKFNFDGAYNQYSTNQQIYATSIRPLVDCAFDGARVSCFAYGQTGSGKTHTMLGNGQQVKGLYLLAAIDIFQELNNYPDIEVWISFYEIYCGKLYDLLNEKNILYAREDAKSNVNIVGLSQRKLSNYQNLMQIIDYGTGIRVTSQNGTNNDSSRSHAILQITLKKKNKVHGKISFIDLAGSERAADHADQLEKQTRIDGAEINKSLLALKQCIRALDQNKNHTPFRGSKLTMVLKDSFTGYCRTVMIGNISPNSSSSQNTLNTLKYADRVKQLKKPNKQNSMQMQKIDQLQKELMLPRTLHRRVKQNNIFKNQDLSQNVNMNSNLQMHQNGNFDKQKNVNKNNNLQANNSSFLNNIGKKPAINMNNFMNNNNNKYFNHNHNHNNNNDKKLNSVENKIDFTNFPKNRQNSPFSNKLTNPNQRNSPFNNKPLLVQQNEPFEKFTQEDLIKLSDRHDQSVQYILEEEEALLKHHQDYINTTIQLTKKEMIIKSQADKIGSRIQDYLGNLSDVLQNKLQSIFSLKQRIEKIKWHLQESKNLQQQYQACSRSLNLHNEKQQEQNLMLLDDDDYNEQLFIN